MNTLIIDSPKKSMIQFEQNKVYDIIHKINNESQCTTQNKYKDTHNFKSHNFCEIDDIIAVILGYKLNIPIYSRDKKLHRFKWKENSQDNPTKRVKLLKHFNLLPNIPISFIESSKYLENKNKGSMYQPEQRYFPIKYCINILQKYQTSQNIVAEFEDMNTFYSDPDKPIYKYKFKGGGKADDVDAKQTYEHHPYSNISIDDLNKIIDNNFTIINQEWINKLKENKYNCIIDGLNFMYGGIFNDDRREKHTYMKEWIKNTIINNLISLNNHDKSMNKFLIIFRGYISHTSVRYDTQDILEYILELAQEVRINVDIIYVHTSIIDHKSNTEGGKKKKTTRKHRGIIQSGGNKGKLRKGYKYSGQKTKTGLPIIVKTKTKKYI